MDVNTLVCNLIAQKLVASVTSCVYNGVSFILAAPAGKTGLGMVSRCDQYQNTRSELISAQRTRVL